MKFFFRKANGPRKASPKNVKKENATMDPVVVYTKIQKNSQNGNTMEEKNAITNPVFVHSKRESNQMNAQNVDSVKEEKLRVNPGLVSTKRESDQMDSQNGDKKEPTDVENYTPSEPPSCQAKRSAKSKPHSNLDKSDCKSSTKKSLQAHSEDNRRETLGLPSNNIFTSLDIFEEDEEAEDEDSSENELVAALDLLPCRPHPEILDSYRYVNALPSHLSGDVLDRIFDEVGSWAEMLNKGKPLPRLVAVQGEVDEVLGIEPLYRDSTDYQPEMTPWTPTVNLLRDIVSNAVSQPLNHAVICCYRHSEDYLSENSCPTLDLSSNSSIVKLSLGTPRTMLLRPKRFCDGERRESPRPTTKVDLTHGSIFCLGPETNRLMTHEIKRISQYPAAAASPLQGVPGIKRRSVYSDHQVRVCITFRHVATFQTERGEVFGKGATSPTLGQLVTGIVSPDKRQAAIKNLKAAFSQESRHADFDYDQNYGGGYDVVPFQYVSSSLHDVPLLETNEIPGNMPLALECEKAISPESSVRSIICNLDRHAELISPLTTPANLSERVGKFEEEKDPMGGSSLAYVSRSLFVGKHEELPESPPSLVGTDSESMSTPSHLESPLSFRMSPVRLPRNNGVALLALDLQNDFLGDDPSFFFGKLGSPIAPRRHALLSRIGELANQVRRMGGVVIFVKSQYGAWSSPQAFGRLGHPGGAHMGEVDCCGVSSAGADFHPEAEMLIVKQDVILIKEWYSAFMGTALHRQLRHLKVGHVVVCGVTTNHSVAATVRSASNLGYNVVLSSDGTAQIDPKSQKETETKLSEYYGVLLRPSQSLSHVIVSDPCERAAADPHDFEEEEIPDMSMEIDAFSRLSGFGAGDSIIVPDFLEKSKASELYVSLLTGASGVDYQFEPNDLGHLPVYRANAPKPWDRNFKAGTFSDPVQGMKSLVESQTGHKLNWGQILRYRDGSESRGWNAENNLDVRAGSFTASVSLGGDRVLELKPKKDDSSLSSQRVLLQHNSLVLLGPETTRLFLHCIPPVENSTEPHIQVTFLDVATFFSRKDSRMGVPQLYGQGSEYGSLSELEEAAATRRIIEQLGIALAGVYTMSTLPPGRGGSLSFSIICTIVATATTALWFQAERLKAWREQERRLEQVYQDCFAEPLSIEEARTRIWQERKKRTHV